MGQPDREVVLYANVVRHASAYVPLSWIDRDGRVRITVIIGPNPRSINPKHDWVAATKIWFVDEVNQRLPRLRLNKRVLRFVQAHLEPGVFGSTGGGNRVGWGWGGGGGGGCGWG